MKPISELNTRRTTIAYTPIISFLKSPSHRCRMSFEWGDTKDEQETANIILSLSLDQRPIYAQNIGSYSIAMQSNQVTLWLPKKQTVLTMMKTDHCTIDNKNNKGKSNSHKQSATCYAPDQFHLVGLKRLPALKSCFIQTSKPTGIVNLLQTTPSTVTVSSVVRNTRNRPSHLVDGQLSTAWNSLTGDVKGSWIKIKVPSYTYVTSIQMTAGYIHKRKKTDLFTANHRIKKVRVFRNRQKLRDVALDTTKRNVQNIPINTSGGEFKIEVLETKRGSKRRWAEVCVSEIQVLGRTSQMNHHTPVIRIATADTMKQKKYLSG